MATKAKPPVTRSRKAQGTAKKRIRKIFGDIHEVVQMPNLIEVQRESYEQFLRSDKTTGYVSGLEKTLRSVFPIRDFAGTAELDFVHYELEEPKYDTTECRQRGITYAAPMKVTLRLIVFEVDQETETRSVLDIKEQDVYMGDMPLMTDNGTFIINGTERVIVSQMHRSPGVLFDHDRGKTHSSGKLLFAARVIPYRGSWLDFEFDPKDLLYFRVDRRRKMPVTILLKAIGLTPEDILREFFVFDTFHVTTEKTLQFAIVPERLRGETAKMDIVAKGKVIVAKDKRITAKHVRDMEAAGLKKLDVADDFIVGRVLARKVVNPDTGEIVANANDEITADLLAKIAASGVKTFDAIYTNDLDQGAFISQTLRADDTLDQLGAQVAIYRMMRPGEPPT
ncbi:MAG: DNA-directed RNA polymerase subunit beta, partial [Sphingomonadales bacterium]